ncbi:fibroblast growth factor receptor-like 1 [Montipora foliosa]|uniref:fibroblast growth factor receptor-like 1 n=1 Tax=Montipora foliosa TaxID=591990 RepID=UPI0035F11880
MSFSSVLEQYPPQFEKRPKLQYNAEAGNDIRLRCLVKGNPPPTVAWIKDQKLVQLSSRIRLNSRGNSTLKIKKTQPDDAGNYTCTATNVLGKINATLELHVHKGTSSPPPTTQVPTPRKNAPPSFLGLKFFEKSYRAWPAAHKIKLKCEAVGAPPLRYKWLKDGHRLLSRLMDPYFNSSLWYLKLKDIVPDDSGDYTCIVTNPYGSINHTYTLNVVAKPRSKPILRNGLPRNTTAKVGDNTTMTCIVLVSGTRPDFRWLKWDKSITSQPKMNEILKDNEAVYKLIDPHYYKAIKVSESYGVQLNINNVSDDDFGLYTCYVSNVIGFDYNDAFLIKYDEPSSPSVLTPTETTEPKWSAPLIIVPPKNLTAEKGDNVTLTCAAVGYPKPLIRWLVDERTTYSSNISNMSNLTITISKDKTAVKCEAENPVALDSKTAFITVPKGFFTGTGFVLVLGFAAVAVLLIVGAAIILYRRRKTQLQNSNPKLLNYEVPRNRMEFIEELEQGNALLFEYDAFIIYSSMDEEWVRGTLLPTLEDKHGLKCCIHYRDFMPGVLYRQNMVNSVYASKKTVAVVSKNFFNSGFCESEFEYALLRLAERRDDNLIVIKLDDIDARKLPLEVRKRSYIDCPRSIEKETWETKLVKSLKFKNP